MPLLPLPPISILKKPISPQYVPQLLRPTQNRFPVASSRPQPTRLTCAVHHVLVHR